jgi:hypothetical protein
MNILYTTWAVVAGGRAGRGRTSHGRIAALACALFAFAAGPADAVAPFAQLDGGGDRSLPQRSPKDEHASRSSRRLTSSIVQTP